MEQNYKRAKHEEDGRQMSIWFKRTIVMFMVMCLTAHYTLETEYSWVFWVVFGLFAATGAVGAVYHLRWSNDEYENHYRGNGD